jgi:metal-dependent amidase/aminoacylase/carboxypeptidase family protein
VSYFEGRSELGDALGRATERAGSEIAALCREIFEHPETAFEEERASALLSEYLSGHGYAVERDLAGMSTAFRASMTHFDTEAMRKGLRHGHVAILAEYDAEESGHRSGRQLVAGAALAAAVGLSETLRTMYGEVSIIGCPAAVTMGGKKRLAEAGVFEPVDVALGAVPAATGLGFQPTIDDTGGSLATARIVARFTGEAGESGARQRLATTIESTGLGQDEAITITVTLTDPGIQIDISATSNPELDRVIERISELVNDVATETGSGIEIDVLDRTPAINVNRILARRIKTFADNMGLKQDRVVKGPPGEPTDWGHVSLVTPTMRAMYPISEDHVEAGTEAFADASITEFAEKQMISCALAIALTGLDVLGDMEFRGFAEGELIRSLNAQGVKRMPRRWLGVHPVLPRESANANQSTLGPLSKPRRGRS